MAPKERTNARRLAIASGAGLLAGLGLLATRATPRLRALVFGPRVGKVDMGALRRLAPISTMYGWDRGTPVDRYYIEAFLARHQDAVRGHVLEISEDTYTRKFGGERVSKIDVLHYDNPAPPATLTGDLTDAPHIASGTFDCVIITQTLMLIYDLPAAIRTLHRILKRGGTVLATMAGLTQIADPEWRDTWYWGLTRGSGRRIFADVFGQQNVEVKSYGNVLATIAFLHGLSQQELTRRELDHEDPDYQMLIGVSARKEG
jgi:hypothetical protein